MSDPGTGECVLWSYQQLDCTAWNGRIVVNDEFKDLEGNGLCPIEICSENFSGETGNTTETSYYPVPQPRFEPRTS
jgi:hypothetical protein